MYENLAHYVVSSPPEVIPTLYLEDIAICAAWYDSHEGDSDISATYGALRQVFDRWVREVEPPRNDTEGYRQQPLIRELVAELTEGNVARLERDELDLLYFTVAFARRSGKLDIFRRVLSCTAPHMNSIEQLRKKKPLIPGAENLAKRLTVATEADIKQAEARDVRTFGGLSLPIRGPVYLCEGSLKIMSGIPAECTVVVDQGHCCVRGAVEGNLAATESCDILDNLSGVVIARRGGINARDILNQAIVLSKEDTVRAVNAESPKMVFAAREIHLREDAMGGRFLARKIQIDGLMCGGDLFVTEHARSTSFVATDERPLRVCLLRGLSCQDYGEVLTMDSSSLLNSAMKLRQRLDHLEELSDLSEREADDLAGNILLFVLGEADTKEKVQDIQKRRQRLSFMERLTAGIRSLVMAAEDRINNLNSQMSDSGTQSSEEKATLDELRRELLSLSQEGSIEPELHQEKEDVLYLGRKLQRRGMSEQGLQQVLERLLAKCEAIQRRANDLSRQLQREEAAIERAMGRDALMERAREECSRVEMLKQLSAAARKRPTGDIFKQRLGDRYVKLLQRTMENRLSHASGYRSTCREVHDRIEQLREKLWREYMVSLPDHVLQGWAVGGARIEGTFSPGILISPWRHLMDDPSGGIKSCAITSSDEKLKNVHQTFVRTTRSTVEALELPPEESAELSINI